MSTFTKLVKEQFETVKEILNLILELFSIISKNKPLVIILSILIVLYLGVKYYAFEVPKSTIYNFHKYIDDQNYDAAWGLLSRRYKKRYFFDNIEHFKNETNPSGMGRYTDLQITDDYDGNNPFSVVFRDNLVFTVSLTRRNIVNIKDLKETGNIYYQFRTSLWTQLSCNRRLDDILKGTFGKNIDYELISKKRFDLIKEDGAWVIEDNPKIFEGYKYKNYQ